MAVVYQDLSLVESLSVADNLLLGREPKTRLGFLKKRQLVAQAEAFLTSQNIPLDARAMLVSALGRMVRRGPSLQSLLRRPFCAPTRDREIFLEMLRAQLPSDAATQIGAFEKNLPCRA